MGGAISLSGTDLGEESAACEENTGALLKAFSLKKKKSLKGLSVDVQALSLLGHRLRTVVADGRKTWSGLIPESRGNNFP